MKAIENLEKQYRRLNSLYHLRAICEWDQDTMMPHGSIEARSKAMTDLEVLCNQILTAPEMSEWIAEAMSNSNALSREETISLKEIRRYWHQAVVLPASLVAAKTMANSKCEYEWRRQRKENDWDGFSKNLREVTNIAREEAIIRAAHSELGPYDAMLDLFEPGMTMETLDNTFDELKGWLPKLTGKVIEKQSKSDFRRPRGPFRSEKQEELCKRIMQTLGFDFDRGRLDVSAHPFCGGVPTDVRVTTRYDEYDFNRSILSVMHETGHACYEQGLPQSLSGLPTGMARSFGIHESQSLLFEMQIGRDPIFVEHLSRLAAETFDRFEDKDLSAENMKSLYQAVEPGCIRIEADEVTYLAHVILRYEIERDLIEGNVEVDDIPTLWRDKMNSYLGVSIEKNSNEVCMQDIHWANGTFGCFPSYALGAMYAAQFMAAMRKSVDIDACLKRLDFLPICTWLGEHVWSLGSTLSTEDLVQQATGETLNSLYLREHLVSRYLSGS